MRRKFSREFKLEAVELVRERGVSVAQACRDLDLAESVLRRWMRELAEAPTAQDATIQACVSGELKRLRLMTHFVGLDVWPL